MDRVWKGLGIVFLLLFIVIQLTPFYIAMTVSAKPRTDLSSRWLPPTDGVYWENYERAIDRGNMLSAIKNSVIITAVSTFFVCLIGCMAGYPLARIKSRWNKVVMLIILGVIMVPPLSTLVPLYTMMNKMEAVNTYWGMILIMITGQLPLSIFLYASFISTLPSSLEEAAVIDGANYIQIFFRIILPLMKPVTATVMILAGTFIWNEYQMSLYMLTTSDMRTITTAIGAFFSQQSSNLGAAAAASLMGMLPILIAYLFLQQYFMKGMVAGAEKG